MHKTTQKHMHLCTHLNQSHKGVRSMKKNPWLIWRNTVWYFEANLSKQCCSRDVWSVTIPLTCLAVQAG